MLKDKSVETLAKERIENNEELERVGKEDEVKEEKGEKEGGGVCKER